MKNKFEKLHDEIEGKKKQNKPRFKEEDYPSPQLKKYPLDEDDQEEDNDLEKDEISYLDIFRRPSFRNVRRNIMSTEDNANVLIVNDTEQESKGKYDYPVNIFKRFLFTWTRKVLKAANTKPHLEISDL